MPALALQRISIALGLGMTIGLGAGIFLVGIDAEAGWFYAVTVVLVAPVVMQGLYPGRGLPSLRDRPASAVGRIGLKKRDSLGVDSPTPIQAHENHDPPPDVNAGRWLRSTEAPLSPVELHDLLARLVDSGTVALDDRKVAVPDTAHAVVRLERTPHGELVLKIELAWQEEQAAHVSHQTGPTGPESIRSELTQRAQEVSAGALAETMLPGYVPAAAEKNLATTELKDLWRRYKEDGDQRARERLVLAYTPLVKYVAGRMSSGLPGPVEEADLISYGLFGLISAIERFDPGRGIRFETFAITRVKGSIIDELRSLDWVPRSVRAKAREIERANAKLEHQLRRAPTDREMADALEMSIEEFQDWLAKISNLSLVALDELWTVSDASGHPVSLLDTIQDPAGVDSAGGMDRTDLEAQLSEGLGRLPERERLVVTLYYYDNLTSREIGEILGVTEFRVWQLHTKAVLRLKSRLVGAA